jgi:hypothetical protein
VLLSRWLDWRSMLTVVQPDTLVRWHRQGWRTAHPTADWTIQQCRAAITGDATHRFLIHDRDAIYALAVDGAIRSMGLRVLKTPARTPQANAFCERLIGPARLGVPLQPAASAHQPGPRDS